MGNCIIVQEEEIKMKPKDGNTLLFPHLSDYSVCNAQHKVQQLYCLAPPQKKPIIETGHGNGILTIKLVLSKQELKDLLKKEGVSIGDIVTHLRSSKPKKVDIIDGERCMGWKPTLDSIPEGKDFL